MSSLQSRFSACRMQQKSSGSPSPSNPIIVFSPQKFELRCGRSSPWRTVVWRHPCALEASAPPPPFPRGVGGVPPSKRDPRCIDGIGVHTWRESSSRPVFGAIRCVQERWFSELTSKRLRRGTFLSVPELITAIEEFMDTWNRNPKPFVWTATVDSIVEKLQRCRQTLENIQPGCTLPRSRKRRKQ